MTTATTTDRQTNCFTLCACVRGNYALTLSTDFVHNLAHCERPVHWVSTQVSETLGAMVECPIAFFFQHQFCLHLVVVPD